MDRLAPAGCAATQTGYRHAGVGAVLRPDPPHEPGNLRSRGTVPACIVVTLFRCTFQALLSVGVYVPVAHTYCTTNVESERSASLAWRNHVAIGACRLCSALNWLAVGRLPCCTHTAP